MIALPLKAIGLDSRTYIFHYANSDPYRTILRKLVHLSQLSHKAVSVLFEDVASTVCPPF